MLLLNVEKYYKIMYNINNIYFLYGVGIYEF